MGGTLRVSTCELRGYWALVQGPPLHAATEGAVTSAALVRRRRQGEADAPCHRCGTLVPVGHTYRLEHLLMLGWRVFAEASYVEWCGHEQRFLVVPHIDRERAALGPIFGEAA